VGNIQEIREKCEKKEKNVAEKKLRRNLKYHTQK
jgi:hypothetical protein